jgi:hypothetical protein
MAASRADRSPERYRLLVDGEAAASMTRNGGIEGAVYGKAGTNSAPSGARARDRSDMELRRSPARSLALIDATRRSRRVGWTLPRHP